MSLRVTRQTEEQSESQGGFPGAVPRHVAIIMDGNGRWAGRRGLPRSAGHSKGVESVRRAVAAALDFGVEYLTLYSFSSENWRRPKEEVGYLLNLLRRFANRDVSELHAQGVRIKVIGERSSLAPDIVTLIERAEEMTQANSAMTLMVAFNYGGRDELARAVRELAQQVLSGHLLPSEITPDLISNHLDTASIPDPELVIRTSGEQRLSNFLLWQSAYSEFVFVEEAWPDFDREIFASALKQYMLRDRRFGGLAATSL
ncbi:undecaprenyl diphosphate synthase [Rhodoligotrophos appendicifer]|uniref:isoprenyl transferase n=1 Tax=Rhodoligotrophos appendicifer TaxID=987056 RepID=UPI001185CC2B|nr:isoprenyl transferase [Rhodoligotrophos appendicifer]